MQYLACHSSVVTRTSPFLRVRVCMVLCRQVGGFPSDSGAGGSSTLNATARAIVDAALRPSSRLYQELQIAGELQMSHSAPRLLSACGYVCALRLQCETVAQSVALIWRRHL